MLQAHTTDFSTLGGHPYLALTSFDNDCQPVVTPVSFAQDGDRLYVRFPADAQVVQRIRRNAQVEVAPCTRHGEVLGASIEAMAVVLPADKAEPAARALHPRFALQTRLHDLLLALRRGGHVYVEITPM